MRRNMKITKQCNKRIYNHQFIWIASLCIVFTLLRSFYIVSAKESQRNPYQIKSNVSYREVKSKDGIILLRCSLMYPQIISEKDNANTRSIKEVNQQIEIDAMLEFQEQCQEAIQFTNEFIDEIYSGGLPVSWLPFSIDVTYEITFNRNGILSFTYTIFKWLGGAHPQTTLSGVIYDVSTGKKMVPTEILNLTEQGIKQLIADEMKKIYEKNPEFYFKEEVEALQKLEFSYGTYLSEDGIQFFFQPYEVAPYVTGIVRVPIKPSEYPNLYQNLLIFR